MTVPQNQIGEVFAFLDHFLASDWASCHVRVGTIEIFVAREAGHANPMLGLPEDAAIEAVETMLTAPHLATLIELAPVGSRIAAGGRYGTIELLGEPIDLVADHDGTIARHLGRPGALLQYEEALVALH